MVQRDLGWATVFDASYVGSLGRQLPFTENINAAAPGTDVAGLPFNVASYGDRTAPIYLQGTGSTSNYNALQLNITKRFSKNLAFTVAYTWSKSLDYDGGLTPFQNNFNPRDNYGLSNFDRTNLLTISHVWQLPFGTGTNHLNSGTLGHIVGPWQLDGIFRYASGSPWTPTADSAICDCPGNTVRAEVFPSGTPTMVGSNPSYFGLYPYAYNVQGYALNQLPAGSYGSAGRNILRGGSGFFELQPVAVPEHLYLLREHAARNSALKPCHPDESRRSSPIRQNYQSVNGGNFYCRSTGLMSGLGPRTLALKAWATASVLVQGWARDRSRRRPMDCACRGRVFSRVCITRAVWAKRATPASRLWSRFVLR